MNSTVEKCDIAIIGSGIGALACASFIAQLYPLKVVVVEQHSQPGGLSQEFVNIRKVSFEIGIHQVGELHSTSMFSKLMDFISRGESVWRKLPDTFIKFHFPDFVYEVSAGEANQTGRLCTLFPDEKDNILSYYKDIEIITHWYRNFTTESIANDHDRLRELLASEAGKLAMMTTREYLEYRFEDPKLRSLIGCHWTDYGLPPSLSAFLKHAILVNNHKEGVYYPEFGSKQLIDSIAQSIKDNGGEFKLNSMVKEIKYTGNRASSVTILNKVSLAETHLEADIFISGIGVVNTYTKLFDEKLGGERLKTLRDFKSYGISFVQLLATLKHDPTSLGADASLSWVFPGYDHEQNFANRNQLNSELISQFSISFPSLKKTSTGQHSMKINTLVDYTVFQQWDLTSEEQDDYLIVKNKIARTLLDAAEKLYPGIGDNIESWDLYTPLSVKKDTQHHNGQIFGIPDTPARYRDLNFNCFTPLENVYVTGSDITSSGIYPAVLSGAITTMAVFKDKTFFLKIIKAAGKYKFSKNDRSHG